MVTPVEPQAQQDPGDTGVARARRLLAEANARAAERDVSSYKPEYARISKEEPETTGWWIALVVATVIYGVGLQLWLGNLNNIGSLAGPSDTTLGAIGGIFGIIAGHLLIPFLISAVPWAVFRIIKAPMSSKTFMTLYTAVWGAVLFLAIVGHLFQAY